VAPSTRGVREVACQRPVQNEPWLGLGGGLG